MPSNNQYSQKYRQLLLQLARKSIKHGLKTGRPLTVELDNYAQKLKEKRATFVTLKKKGQLRGCIGMLEAVRPLVEDIAKNAFAAAFKDPRFSPLQEEELSVLEIHLSILSPSEPISFRTEEDLLTQLNPDIDGLILEDGLHRATFLPSVWESLPEPKQFLRHLKIKAGLTEKYWSSSIKFYRYSTEIID